MDGNVPNIPNVLFYKGLFKDTIPMFKQEKLNDKDIRIGLIHIDCDLYSSTCDILDELIDYIVPGVIIVFDEWNVRVKKEKQNILHQGGEQIAFLEWSKKYNKNYTTIEDEHSYPDPQRYIIKIEE